MNTLLNLYLATISPKNQQGIDFDSWFNTAKEIINTQTNDEFQISSIEYKGRGYGFASTNNSFCHASHLVGADDEDKDFEDFCNEQTLFLIHSYKGQNGLWASWFCPVEKINERAINTLFCYFQQAANQLQEEEKREDPDDNNGLFGIFDILFIDPFYDKL